MNWSGIKNKAAELVVGQPGLNVTATWGEKSFVAVRTMLKRADVNSDAGLFGIYAFSLLAARADFATLPSPRRDKIAVEGKTYRVLAVETDSIGATVRIHLGGEQQ